MRKIRLWVCRKCGRAWNRKRKETESTFKCCGEYTERARKFPKRRTSRYERIEEKIEKFNERYSTKPRTNIGTVLKLSKETKKAFGEIKKSKQKRTFLKRANIFIALIAKDVKLYKTEKDSDSKWCRRIDNEGEISKAKGGMSGIPGVIFAELNPYTLGLYTQHLLKGILSIQINPTVKDFTEMSGTLAHETLHWIDAMNSMKCNGHDCFWKKRLERFESMLNIN